MQSRTAKFTTGSVPQFFMGLVLVILFFGCKKGGAGPTTTPPPSNPTFAKGADISWLTQMEASGYKFYNSAGSAMDGMELIKSLGINAIRLRVWVNPAGGWNNNA